jgi:hypothetical protein
VKAAFDFHGLGVAVSSEQAALVEEVRRDFSYFEARHHQGCGGQTRADVAVTMNLEPPDYAALPSIAASLVTPRNVCFRDGTTTYIDYSGEGLVVLDRPARRCTASALDHDLLHEIAYLFILSTVGEHLDGIGLHRLHALGIAYHGRGIALLLPSGGGKSTMALELLREPGVQLLGEDTPLVDKRGWLVPMPIRLGARPGQPTGVPDRHLRTVKRMEFGPKTLIDAEYFRDRFGGPVEPAFMFVGQRSLGTESEISPLSYRQALHALIKYMVVGLGVYQGIEFLLERGWRDVAGRGGVAASRFRNALRFLARTRPYRFVLGRDTSLNVRTLLTFLDGVRQPAAAPQLATLTASAKAPAVRRNCSRRRKGRPTSDTTDSTAPIMRRAKL